MWWTNVNENLLAQGDLLPDCLFPHLSEAPKINVEGIEASIRKATLIVVSQTCDLQNSKIEFVALCPINSIDEFEKANPAMGQKGAWEKIRRGERPGLHLVASPENPNDNQSSLVIDFGHIVSIPFDYLTRHAESTGNRWRLKSPYLEHFSQAFARFFMRVGLPSSIPPFKK